MISSLQRSTETLLLTSVSARRMPHLSLKNRSPSKEVVWVQFILARSKQHEITRSSTHLLSIVFLYRAKVSRYTQQVLVWSTHSLMMQLFLKQTRLSRIPKLALQITNLKFYQKILSGNSNSKHANIIETHLWFVSTTLLSTML